MKVEVKEVENEGFKPFKIEITIETLAELKDLLARTKLTRSEVNSFKDNTFIATTANYEYEPLHEILTGKM